MCIGVYTDGMDSSTPSSKRFSASAVPSSFPGGAVVPDACREAERLVRESWGVPEDELIERASRGAWRVFRETFPWAGEFAVVAGPGSNGADGLALARHAVADGFRPHVLLVGRAPASGGSSARQLARLAEFGIEASPWSALPLPEGSPAVDAMYGTGLARPLEGDSLEAARWLSSRPTLALDIPSGLDGSTGNTLGEAVVAVATATFGRSKPGLHLHPGRDHAGAVHVVDIGIPAEAWEQAGGAVTLLDDSWACGRLAPRARGSHKGDAGRLVLLCGSDAFPGAAFLCCEAALRSGAGLVHAITTESVAFRLPLRVPEAIPMAHVDGSPDVDRLVRAISQADALLAGPGLSLGSDAHARLAFLLEKARAPIVLDADALNLCALRTDLRESFLRVADAHGAVVTPHPMEASRMLGRGVEDLLADPLSTARELAGLFHSVVVFKTASPVVADPSGRLAVGIAGHAGMAVGGCGDALAGAVVARVGEGATPWDAACEAVRAHARAGDLAGARGWRGMSVTDLVAKLPEAWQEMER